MATPSRRADPALKDKLFQESHRFDFFQAVRVLERLFPARQPVGQAADPAQEIVRFRTRASLSFPASDIYEIRDPHSTNGAANPKNGQLEMVVNFMGLTGPAGVLPRHYTESLMEQARRKRTALWDFLDLFNHRLISLFYCASEKSQLPVSFTKGAADRFASIMFALMGIATAGLRHRPEIPEAALLFCAGLISQRPCSTCALEAILRNYFEVPVTIEQFQGQWLAIDEDDGSSLGDDGKNNQLGVSTTIGDWVWDEQATFRITVGPIDFDKLFAFLPDGNAYLALNQITRFLVGDELDFEIRLILRTYKVPPWRLGDTDAQAPRLGWCTWLTK